LPLPNLSIRTKATSDPKSTKEGFYTEQASRSYSAPGAKIRPKVPVKIPRRVIQNCVGLAIFTTMGTGMWVSGAGGSGVLIARKEDGSWSPPSGLLVHTLGVGFMAGIDIYDCVVVINNREALEAFSKVRVSLGGETVHGCGTSRSRRDRGERDH
jgi:lipid-binding SYLF domain-containing protein